MSLSQKTEENTWTTKKVLLLVTGGIAAYKALELIRLLRDRQVEVRVILTAGGSAFVTPLSLATLSNHPVYEALFDSATEAEIGHIALARWPDLIVVCPATAHFLAKMAHGLGDDLALTVLLATNKPILVAPAMNVKMWEHPAMQANLATLIQRGVLQCGPEEGPMACGEYGLGRLSEPASVFAAIERFFFPQNSPLCGKKILITAGPTREPIDPVRFLTNHSSGKQGYALAEAASKRGADVVLVSGPVSLPCPPGVKRISVETAAQMYEACLAQLPCALALCTAAVSDWKVDVVAQQKLKKNPHDPLCTLMLSQTVDILKALSNLPHTKRPSCVVGFAAETEHVLENAEKKRQTKGCDMIVANDVSQGAVFGRDVNQIVLMTAEGAEAWPSLPKKEVAERLMDYLERRFSM